jgi:hypothetical protein
MRYTCVVVLLVTACGNPDGRSRDGGGHRGSAGSDEADEPAACGDREIAPGYPKVGAGCRTHASVQIDANMHELIGAHGIGPVGSALSGVAVTDDTEAFVLTLPSLEPGDYDGSHQCATLDMPDLFTSHDGGIRVTAHTSADAVWGNIDATTAKVIRYILIGTELTRVWGYVRVTGRFAALRDAPIDCPNCTPMIDEVHISARCLSAQSRAVRTCTATCRATRVRTWRRRSMARTAANRSCSTRAAST